ncbi:uncharacterized protein DNG_07150 [Cephalotrichum gorgonifer]|uniref:Uncharacterized protein n=1 Tax=Cephalotrichum gorgonifer TaxID=2041049 RepID=A0AAE8N435_9PEZI|nr:uncharacterized protein DNG_07150 [Cephalotrichum gorgonifer]
MIEPEHDQPQHHGTPESVQEAAPPPETASCFERHWTQRFAHGIYDWALENRITARELAMLRVMNSITEKPGWETEIFDDEVAASWKAEAVANERLMSLKAWNWCLRELRDKATNFARTGRVLVYDVGPTISKSKPGELVGGRLKSLVNDIVTSTDVCQSDCQLHEGDQVVNIVDPSLYSLAYGITKVLPRDESEGGGVDLHRLWEKFGKGTQSVLIPHEDIFRQARLDSERAPELLRDELLEDRPWRYSNGSQWLPCEAKFSNPDGNDCKVKIESYINNLHPTSHRQIYSAVEDIISASIQPWNDTVTFAVPGNRSWHRNRLIVGSGRAGLRIRLFELAEMTPLSPKGICWREEGNFFGELQGISDAWDTLAPETRDNALQDVIARMERAEYVLVRGGMPIGLDSYREEMQDRLAPFLHPDAGVLLSYEDWKSNVIPPRTIPWDERVPSYDSSEDEDERRPDDLEWTPSGSEATSSEQLPTCPHCTCWQSPAALIRLTRGKYARDLESNRTLNRFDDENRQAQLQRDFRNQGLQVYVRIQSIQLTPEHPRYEGSDWAVEGMLNERIVASSVYFFDMENVKADSASMSFRVQARLTSTCHARPGSEDRKSLVSLFAIDGLVSVEYPPTPTFSLTTTRFWRSFLTMTPLTRTTESPISKSSYRMGPVELRDPLKPGHVRFLTLCLADPNYRLVSTKRVVPQRLDWWMRDVFPWAHLVRKGLPAELVCQIAEEATDQVIAPQEARELWFRASREKERMMAELNSVENYLAFPDGPIAH